MSYDLKYPPHYLDFSLPKDDDSLLTNFSERQILLYRTAVLLFVLSRACRFKFKKLLRISDSATTRAGRPLPGYYSLHLTILRNDKDANMSPFWRIFDWLKGYRILNPNL